MLQRLVTAGILVSGAVAHLGATQQVGSVGPQFLDAGMGILILVGLWTPVVGTAVACRELWIALPGTGDPWTPLILATLGATLAMIGPGAWSIDARLFGRRQIKRLR